MLGLGLSIPEIAIRGRRGFSPASLFANGEQGAWYDLNLTEGVLWQDSAGTTAVTAVEQPVGLMLDKSGRGNHAFNPNATTVRPTLSARYNLLTYSEQFDNAAWGKFSQGSADVPTVTANAGTDPLGGNTADRIQFSRTGTTTVDRSRIQQAVSVVTNTVYQFSVWLKSFDGTTQTVSIFPNWGDGALLIATVTNEWQRFTVSANTLSGTTATALFGLGYSVNSITSADVLAWGADLRVANESATIPYQRVVTATDYDADPAKFPYYLRFDGSDDWLQTASVDFTATDKMSVFAGVRKLSDAALGIIAELSTSLSANNGTWVTYTPLSGSDNRLLYGSKGTVAASAISNNLPAPVTNILTGLGDISGDSTILRINGAAAATNTADQGTGNFGNYPLYIGRRGGTTLPFNGRLYSLIIRGALTDAATIALAEDYVETKTFGKNMNLVYSDEIELDGEQITVDGDPLFMTVTYE